MAKKKTISHAAPGARLMLDERKTAIAGAALGALGTLSMSVGMMSGAGMMGRWGYGMMGSAYAYAVSPYGFVLSPFGWLVNLLLGAAFGAIAGYVLAWTYNRA
jgi:hypothetical protein